MGRLQADMGMCFQKVLSQAIPKCLQPKVSTLIWLCPARGPGAAKQQLSGGTGLWTAASAARKKLYSIQTLVNIFLSDFKFLKDQSAK